GPDGGGRHEHAHEHAADRPRAPGVRYALALGVDERPPALRLDPLADGLAPAVHERRGVALRVALHLAELEEAGVAAPVGGGGVAQVAQHRGLERLQALRRALEVEPHLEAAAPAGELAVAAAREVHDR